MQYFDIKKSLPVFCSLLITACSGGGGGNNPSQYPKEVRPVVTEQAKTAKEVILPTPSIGSEQSSQNVIAKDAFNVSEKTHQHSKPEKIAKDINWTGSTVSSIGSTWWQHKPNNIPVFTLILNENQIYSDEKNFTLEQKHIDLTKNNILDEKYFHFTLLDSGIYYGNYLSSYDQMNAESNYVFAFDKDREYTGKDITANYYGNEGFKYSVKLGNTYLSQVGDVHLIYREGKVSGEIFGQNNVKHFSFMNSNKIDPNSIVIVPEEAHRYLSRNDKMFLEMHFINGENGEKYKYIVGSGKTDKYYGALFATKQENQ
ncbi:hypothetical protein AAIB13_09325 [Pasteurella multocida]|uniref:hypothetical protein n=1 Tax=Pasteurella multocida TaxID=747 RepID=UPI0031BA293F